MSLKRTFFCDNIIKKNNSKEIYYSWEDIMKDTEVLAGKIKKNFKPDGVVVIALGGWIPARIMKNFIPSEYYSFGCKSYDDGNNQVKTFKIYQTIPSRNIVGKNILIFDEVCDSGRTLRVVNDIIQKMKPIKICTAVLHQKAQAKFQPDFFARKIKDIWIHYPWDMKK